MARSFQSGDRAWCSTLLLLAGAMLIVIPGVVVPALAEPAVQQAAGAPYAAHVAEAARRFSIPAAWIRAVMRTESRGDRRAVSPKGAMGLMQIMPETWAELRTRYGLGRDPFDPHNNILAGAAYLRDMYDRYGFPGFLAAYNAGPGRYEEYRDRHRPLPAETIAYVAAIAPFVDGGSAIGPVLVAASNRSSWSEAPLFVVRADGPPTVDHARSDRPPRDTPTAAPVRDLSAIAPQPDGLFVARSAQGRSQ